MNNLSIYIDDVAAVTAITTAHLTEDTGGTLTLRVVSKDPTGAIGVTEVNLQTWRARDWDMLRDIARAIETAQSAGEPQAPEDEATGAAAAEEDLIASMRQV